MKKSKIIIGITLFIFFVITTSIVTAGLLNNNKNQNTLNTKNKTRPTTANLTNAEVVKHNKASDCWMVISNNVYDFTSYIPNHPGGFTIVPYCGKDGTVAFQTKGGQGNSHSERANNLMNDYLLGPLE